jgi:hypothetical protein
MALQLHFIHWSKHDTTKPPLLGNWDFVHPWVKASGEEVKPIMTGQLDTDHVPLVGTKAIQNRDILNLLLRPMINIRFI